MNQHNMLYHVADLDAFAGFVTDTLAQTGAVQITKVSGMFEAMRA
jgi:hypothetical protein